MSYFNKAKELFRMIENGKMLDAFDLFYHPDVVVIQADGVKRIGVDANKNYEKDFLNNIQEIFGAELLSITSDEERHITMVEYWVHIKFKDGSRKKYEEVSVHHWKDDKIIKERFYESKS